MLLSVWAAAPRPWTDLLALARHAEATGWHGIWVADAADRPVEAWAALGGLAVEVAQLRLGTLVSNPGDRHPAVLTKLAVTVDHLSGGRAVLGLGAGLGPSPGSGSGSGLGLGPRGDRLARLAEACEVVKALLANERTTFNGKHFRLDDAPLEPKAVQDPLPLLVAGAGGQTLRIAARWADEWNGWGDPATLTSTLRALDAHCAAFGRDPRTVRRSVVVLVAGGREDGARPRPGLPFPVLEPGQVGPYAERCAEAGISELVVSDQLLGDGVDKWRALDAIKDFAAD